MKAIRGVLFSLALGRIALGSEPCVRTYVLPGYDDPRVPGDLDAVAAHRYFVDDATSPLPRAVLLLVPDLRLGGAWYDRLARRLVERGGVEVWVAERRERLLEDRELLDALDRDPKLFDLVRDTYLGKPGSSAPAKDARWKPLDGKSAPLLRFMGIESLYGDLHRVLNIASRLTAAPIVMGGSGRAAALVMGYGTTEFEKGRVGSDELAGILLLDPEFSTGDPEAEAARNRERQASAEALSRGDLVDGSPQQAIQWELALKLAATDPRGKSPFADPLVPASIRRSGLTNEAFAGFLLDRSSDRTKDPKPFVDLARFQVGELDEPGGAGLRGWKRHAVVREKTALGDVAEASRAPGGLFEWYPPRVLSFDLSDLECKQFVDEERRCAGLGRVTIPIFTLSAASDPLSTDSRGPARVPAGLQGTLARLGTKAVTGDVAVGLLRGDLLFSADAAPWIDKIHAWLLERRKS